MTSKEAIQRRKAILEKIRKRGIYLANQEVMVKGGVFQVEQCPKKRTPYTDFLPCEHCLGYYHKDTLYKHLKTCFWSREETTSKSKSNVQFNSRLFHNIDTAVSAALKNILSTLHHSEVKLVLYKDPVLNSSPKVLTPILGIGITFIWFNIFIYIFLRV